MQQEGEEGLSFPPVERFYLGIKNNNDNNNNDFIVIKTLRSKTHITFTLNATTVRTERGPRRNPRKTDWPSYVEALHGRMS